LDRIGGCRRITSGFAKATTPNSPHHYVIGISRELRICAACNRYGGGL
jgi:hypothetical protein